MDNFDFFDEFLCDISGAKLTSKEKSVYCLLLFYSNKEICSILHLSLDGVRYHIKHLYEKTNMNRDEIRKSFCLYLISTLSLFLEQIEVSVITDKPQREAKYQRIEELFLNASLDMYHK